MLLVCLATALNAFPVTLPGEAHFFLGSFVSMILVLALPQPWAVLAAAVSMAPTIVALGHPLPFFLITAEAIWLGVAQRWSRRSSILQDAVFWVGVGGPLVVWLTYGIARLPVDLVAIVVIKQVLNQFLAVVLAVFVLRHTRVGAWLVDCPVPHRRMRSIVFYAAVVLAMIPVALAAVGVSALLWAYCVREDEQVLGETSRRYLQQLELFLGSHEATVTALANTLSRGGGDPAILLEEIRRSHPGFATMLVADAQGRVQQASPARPLSLATVADREYFRAARDRDRPFVSGVFRGRGFGRDIIVAVSAPIHDAHGKFAGVVEGSLEVRRFAQLIVGETRNADPGCIFTDAGGRVIFSSVEVGIPSLASLRNFPQADLLTLGWNDTPLRFDQTDARGRSMRFTAYRARSEKSGIVVIVQRPLLAGLEGSGWLVSLFLVICAVSLGAAAWVTRVTRRQAAGPLESFAENATRQAAAQSVAPMEVELADAPHEVWVMFRAFNELARQLQGTYAVMQRANEDLDRRVAARTVEAETARQQAETANKSKTDFLAMTGHEIRTPLNAILGLTDALIDSASDPQATERLRTIRNSGARLLNVLNELLDLSKIEAGKLELHPVPVELGALCEEVRALFTARAQQRGLGLDLQFCSPTPLWLNADGARLQQVLINLVGNALKFTAVGRVCLSVDTMAETAEHATVRFAVRDTGPGISAEQKAKLFQPYMQLDHGPGSATITNSGTGLGLAISHQLVGLMGGEMAVCSEVGHGAEFFFTVVLPRATAPVVAQPGRGAGSLARTGPRVLAVDDNLINQEVLRSMLEARCTQLVIVDGADAALAELERTEFDVAFVDLEMPERDGFFVAQTVRAWQGREASRGCRLVACSAHRRDQMWMKCAASGFDDFVEKPIDRAALLSALAVARPVESAT